MNELRDILLNSQGLKVLANKINQPMLIDDRALQKLLEKFRMSMDEFKKTTESLDITQTLGEIKYIGNRLNEIEKFIEELKFDGLRKNIAVEVFVNGKPQEERPGIAPDEVQKPQKDIRTQLIEELGECCAMVIMKRFELFGEKYGTFTEIGKQINRSAGYCSLLFRKGLRRLRKTTSKKLVKSLNSLELVNTMQKYV